LFTKAINGRGRYLICEASNLVNLLELSQEDAKRMLARGNITVAVVGLGWMGMPTACLLADNGAKVIGVDINPNVVQRLNDGNCLLDEPGLDHLVKKLMRTGKLKATTKIEEASSQSDVIIIVVPTLIDQSKKPDYSAIENVCREISKGLRKGSLIIFTGTCGPGVTERITRSILEKHSGLKAGEDFGLGYSPLRAMGGRALTDLQSYNRVVAGIDKKSLDATCTVLSAMTKGEMIKTRNIRTAEATKLFETIYRDVNIGLANEFAIFCEKTGIDYVETMMAANSQPYSHLLVPSAGVGGHCLPVYPYMLLDEARSHDVKLRIVKTSRSMNEDMPRHVVGLAADGLRSVGKSLRRVKVTVLGISYRPNVKEIRYSPSLELLSLLKRRGARITVYDPRFSCDEMSRFGYHAEPTLRKAIEKADCVIITVAHDEFRRLDARDLTALMVRSPVIVDCAHLIDPAQAERGRAIYRGVGRGLWSK
jgi:UDP-N-acetyl-D-mannosaminuronic acid dehydrogenase